MSKQPYRNGKVHIMSQMCATCIFRPGNLMNLEEGRVEQMVATATENNTAIVCHDTLDHDRAVCSGFFKLHATSTLQLAERFRCIKYVDP